MVLAPTTVAMMSAVSYTMSKFIGDFKGISTIGLIFFDLTNSIYFITALFLYHTGLNGSELVKMKKIKLHKILVGIGIITQYNFTAYLIPYRDWWVFAPFFIFFTIFFFDSIYTGIVSGFILISTFLSWYIRFDIMWEPDGPYKFANTTFRFSYLFIFTFLLISLSHMGGKYLVEELEKYANYDTLTHLLNRRSMGIYMHDALRSAKAGKRNFSLAMLDIDDFKKVNDTYGHECGDEVLRSVAKTIVSDVNKDDYVFRWGGEEICIIFRTDLQTAIAAAERIRHDIELSPVKYRDDVVVKITVTMGLSAYQKDMTVQNMMDDADEKLYFGKRHGKNRVVSSL